MQKIWMIVLCLIFVLAITPGGAQAQSTPEKSHEIRIQELEAKAKALETTCKMLEIFKPKVVLDSNEATQDLSYDLSALGDGMHLVFAQVGEDKVDFSAVYLFIKNGGKVSINPIFNTAPNNNLGTIEMLPIDAKANAHIIHVRWGGNARGRVVAMKIQ